MVQNAEWGPHLWKILHICASRCGKQFTPQLQRDELRAWIHLLQLTEAIMPCAICRNHYREWRKTHSLERLTGGTEDAEQWLWSLHDEVNQQRGTGRPSFEEVRALYATATTGDLHESLQKLMEVLERAKLERLIDGAFVREWRQRLSLLRRFIMV